MASRLRRGGGIGLGMVAVLLGAAGAQVQPIGPQVQVNTYATGSQTSPAIASDAAGNVMVVWQSDGSAGTDTHLDSIQSRRYDAAGVPVGGELQVNSYTTGNQRNPAIAATPAGDFVVVWDSAGSAGTDSSMQSIQAQRYDSTGTPLGTQVQVNTYTTGFQLGAAIAADGAGNFVVVWYSNGSAGPDSSGLSVQAQRFDSGGSPLGPQFQVNTYTSGDQYIPDVASDAAGNFVVVWRSVGSSGSDTSDASIQGQRFDSSGTPVGGEFQVNTYTTDAQTAPVVLQAAAGAFVVVWQSTGSAGTDTSAYSIQGQRYDGSGTPLGGEFQVNTYTTGEQARPEVSTDFAGNVVVLWDDNNRGTVAGQRYDSSSGVPIGGEFRVASLVGLQCCPAAAPDPMRDFVVAWASNASAGTDGDSLSIQLQRAVPARVRGKRLAVRAPTGAERRRSVVALGRESATDIGPILLGDPTVGGATLRVVTAGGTGADETYALPAAGWTSLATGYRYAGPVAGEPVKRVLLKRTAKGAALVKAVLRGSLGTQSLDVVPPNPGDEGGLELTITDGGTYCVAFGGAAGGTERGDDAGQWLVVNATADGCP